MGKLDDQFTLITAGSEGIGFATAQRFISIGAEHAFSTGRREAAFAKAVKGRKIVLNL
jgi:NAD(P)-dependent dehydrogenase (short-subunit alcohol dehydrogenase family)